MYGESLEAAATKAAKKASPPTEDIYVRDQVACPGTTYGGIHGALTMPSPDIVSFASGAGMSGTYLQNGSAVSIRLRVAASNDLDMKLCTKKIIGLAADERTRQRTLPSKGESVWLCAARKNASIAA